MQASPTGLGFRSRRCSLRSSAASVPCLVPCLARSWLRRLENSASLLPAMHRVSISSSTDAFSLRSSQSRRVASPACSTTFAVTFDPPSYRPRPPCRLRWNATMVEPLLRVEHVSKRFGGLLALDRASFSADIGRITALIGPNGAGKTTLFSIIAGSLPPDQGRIVYDGVTIEGERPHRLVRRGIARTFQIVQPFAGLTVRENIAVGTHLLRPARADALAAAGDVAHEVGLGDLLDRPAATLTVAGRKRLELARALAIAPRLLLLDEVLAGLNPSEIRDMVPVISAIRNRGITIVMVEHVMQAVMNLAEHVFVLSEGPPDAIAADPRVVEAYLGRDAAGRMMAAGKANA